MPITALYFGPLALPAYYRWGRPRSERWQREPGFAPEKDLPAATGGTPGGAASATGHVIVVPLIVLSGLLTIVGEALWVRILLIAVVATVLLFVFEYFFSIVSTRGLSSGEGLMVTLLIAFVTVLAFDGGMGGWMLVMHYLLFMPPPTDVTFLFPVQVGFILGFSTGYPAVLWLVRGVIKTTA